MLRCLLVLFCMLAQSVFAVGAEADSLALRQRLLEAEAELEALRLEEKLGSVDRSLDQRRAELADAVPKLNRIADRLKTTGRARQEALDVLAGEVAAERAAALKLWRDAAQTLLDLQEQGTEFEAERDAISARRRLFDWPMILTTGWGVLTLLAALGLVLHERRTDLRRWWRGSTAVVLLGALVLPGFAAAEDAESVAEMLKRTEADLAAVKERVSRQRTAHLDSWAGLLVPTGGEGLTMQGKQLRQWEESAMESMRGILVASAVARRAAAETDRLLTQAQRQREDLSRAALRSRLAGVGHTAARVGLCLFFLLGPLGLFMWARRSLRKRLAEDARTCPRCLARDTLAVRKSPRQDPLYPDPRHVECTGCRHEFRERHRRLPRLCFPTAGIRNSGKTRWLGTAYLQVLNAQTPPSAALHAAPSLAEQQEFAEVLRQIAEAEHTAPTVHDVYLPAPLTMHLEDRDRWGNSQALVNLFDFSGEVMNRDIDADLLRRRALLMEGIVLFLDPTQVFGGMLEQQRDALRRFHDDLRDMRKVPVDTRVQMPVAVCLSRLDLLRDDSPFGPLAGEWLQRLRGTAHQPFSLQTMRERSKLCEEALPFMFQGWDVGRELRERFGAEVLFFPLTSVGLYDEEGDLGSRTFEPFGLFEPLLWLLHRHGYCVLDGERKEK